MSEEQLRSFIEVVKGDRALQANLRDAKSTTDVAVIAKTAGFESNVFDIDTHSEPLRDEELEQVSGGVVNAGTGMRHTCVYTVCVRC